MAKTIDMDNPSWKYQKFDAIVDNKIHSILVMFEKIHQIKSRVISIIDYFVFSIATKVFISLLGLVFGVSVFSISQIALLTFLLDYFAVYTLIEAKFSDRKTETLTDFSNAKDVLSFFLLPLLLVLSGFILKPFVNAPLQDVVIAVSLIFQVLLSTYCVLFRSCVAISEKSISFAAGCLFFSLSCVFFAPLGKFFSVVGGVASFLGAFCVLVVFIILITMEEFINF
jgi:hypothetical protein